MCWSTVIVASLVRDGASGDTTLSPTFFRAVLEQFQSEFDSPSFLATCERRSLKTALKLLWNCSKSAAKQFFFVKLIAEFAELKTALRTALKVLWKCSESALKLLWNCSETALKLLLTSCQTERLFLALDCVYWSNEGRGGAGALMTMDFVFRAGEKIRKEKVL